MARRFLIVPAAGIGSRMAADRPKQYLRVGGRFLIDVTLQRLLSHPFLKAATVALHPRDGWWGQTESAQDSRIRTCVGGRARSDSVRNALAQIADQAAPEDWVLVHDVARPCIRRSDLDNLFQGLKDDTVGGLLGAPIADTVKREDADGRVAATLDRNGLWRAFTPQMFRYGLLHEALERAATDGVPVTDEASAVERLEARPRLIRGQGDNIKVTLPADLAAAVSILRQLAEEGE